MYTQKNYIILIIKYSKHSHNTIHTTSNSAPVHGRSIGSHGKDNHQSWSMKGLKERLEAYKQYYKRSTDFSIESSSGGTSVRIQFPLVERVSS
ncbi:MAG: hypothetical protein WD048_15970 [Chitinophagales bacterium]